MTGSANVTDKPERDRPKLAVQERVAADGVHLRDRPIPPTGIRRSASPARFAAVLAIGLLVAGGAFVARGGLGAGDDAAVASPDASLTAAEGTASPDGTAPADSALPDASAPEPTIGEPEPTEPTDDPTPKPTAEVADPTPEEPAWTPRIWSFDPDARFEASVELTESCLLPGDGWEVPHAQVMFQITWDGDVPLALIENLTDGVDEGGYGGDIEVSGTFGLGVIATTADPHVLTIRFFADTEEIGPGTPVKEIDTPFEVDPTESCY